MQRYRKKIFKYVNKIEKKYPKSYLLQEIGAEIINIGYDYDDNDTAATSYFNLWQAFVHKSLSLEVKDLKKAVNAALWVNSIMTYPEFKKASLVKGVDKAKTLDDYHKLFEACFKEHKKNNTMDELYKELQIAYGYAANDFYKEYLKNLKKHHE